MYISKKRGGTTASPVRFSIKDTLQQKLVKNLVSTMIAYDPSERPDIDDVLKELEVITGMLNTVMRLMFNRLHGDIYT